MPRVLSLDRTAVRRRFEERFSAKRMALDYVSVYEALLRRMPDNGYGETGVLARGSNAPIRQLRVTASNSNGGNGSRGHVD